MVVEIYEPTPSGVLVPTDYSRSLENPAVPLSNPAVVENFGLQYGGGSIAITERSVLRYGPFFRGVNLLSDSFASLPLDVMVRLQPSGKAKDISHPAYRALRWKPNRLQTAYIFKKQMLASAIIWGNGYALIDRSNMRQTRLSFLLPYLTRAIADDEIGLFYETFIRGERKILFPDEVLHLRGFSENGGLSGVPLVRLMAGTPQLAMSAEKYGVKFFENGARASGILTHPPTMTKAARRNVQEEVAKRKEGLDNASKLMMLFDGVKYQPLTINQDEAQFLETREFQAREVAVWLGIPPNKLGDTTRTSYSSLEQENQAYLNEGVNPWLVNFEQECRDKLLSEDEQEADSHVVKFNRRGFVQANLATRTEAYNKGILGGWMNRDEPRDAEDMNPIPDGEGEKFLIPANMVVVGEDDDEPESDAPARLLLLETLRRMAALEISTIDRAAKRKGGLTVDQECQRHRERLNDSLKPVLSVVAPSTTAESISAAWSGETFVLIEAGADLQMLSDHRCVETVKRVFGSKKNGKPIDPDVPNGPTAG